MWDPNKIKSERKIFYLFEGTIFLKGFNGVIEICGGILTTFLTHNYIIRLALKITHQELGEDANDFFGQHILTLAQNFSTSTRHFVAFYLFSHGITNIILAISLLQKKLWAYPAAIVVTSLSSLYQIFRYTHTHSVWLLVLTSFDMCVIWLTWHEYNIQKKVRNNEKSIS